jgi:polyisoprenyl-phosphate glycosyltransferase
VPTGIDLPLISIICPVFNEQEAVPLFYDRLRRVRETLSDRYRFELIFTNNRSTDGTLNAILELRKSDPSVQVVTLSRNFGYQASIQCGLSNAAGRAMTVIDVDCEDPPELVSQFLAKWEEGYDIVYGIRQDRPEAWPLKKLRNGFYRILRATADMDIILYMAEFALIGANVRDSIINNHNTFPFLRSEIGYAGFSRYGIEYTRQPRIAGQTHYNLTRMSAFAIGGILSSSTFLLRAAAYLWPVLVVLNIALLTVFASTTAFRVLVAIDLLWVAWLVTVHGLYIARIYKNGIGRPVFIVDRRLTILNDRNSATTDLSSTGLLPPIARSRSDG